MKFPPLPPPRFLCRSTTDRTQNFFTRILVKSWYVFCFCHLKILFLGDLAAFIKFVPFENKAHFLIVPSLFCFFCAIESILFEERKKKPAHPNLIPVLRERIIAQKDVFVRGKFLPILALELPDESILEFRIDNNFYSTHRDLFILKVLVEPFFGKEQSL